MTNIISEENNQHQDTSSSEEKEKILSEVYYPLDKLKKLKINNDINLFFVQDCSYVSLSPIIPTDKLDILFKLYNLPSSKEELYNKMKNYISIQESKINKIYISNNVRVQKSHGNITIIDEQFNKNCVTLSKTSNDAVQLIADKIALILFNTKYIIYKYKKEKEKMIYAIATLKLEENIYFKSDFFESEKNARNNVNKKIIVKYLPKKIVKEIMSNIEKLMDKEDKIKCGKKERYERHLSEAGNDHKLLNVKRKLSVEEFSKRLPYFKMLPKDNKKKTINKKTELSKYKIKETKKKKINNINNIIPLDEEKEENIKSISLKEIKLGDPLIVDKHLRDFKYTPLKLFEMIRDSEKYRGVDLKLEYSNINDKNYSVKIEAVIISQKLGIKVEGYGNSKEEAGNRCSLNLLKVLFKKIFKTFYQVHDYFEHKNKRYLDIILKKGKNKDENNINININKNILRYTHKRIKEAADSHSLSSSNSKEESLSDQGKMSLQFKDDEPKNNSNNRNSQNSNSSSDSQENYVRFDIEQMLNSEVLNNNIYLISFCLFNLIYYFSNIISKMNNYLKSSNSSNSYNSKELDDLLKNSSLGLSEGKDSISNSK